MALKKPVVKAAKNTTRKSARRIDVRLKKPDSDGWVRGTPAHATRSGTSRASRQMGDE